MNNSTIFSDICIDNDDFIYEFKRIVEGWILSGVSLFGIIGNTLTCVILLHPEMRKSSTNLYILALSFVNIIVLIVFILSHGLRWIFYNSCSNIITSYELFYIKIFLYIYPIHITSVLTSIYLATSVTIDRFLIICLPYRMKKYHSKKSSLIVIISVCSFCIIYCLPFWFEFTHENGDNNLTLVLSSLGKHIIFRLLMRKYLYLIFVFLLPLSILIICKTFIIKQLIILRNKKRKLCTQDHSTNSITLLLLSLAGIFLLTQFPYFLFNTFYALKGPLYMETTNARLYLSVNNVLSVTNASCVFILYSFFGHKFRYVFQSMFCCCNQRKNEVIQFKLIRKPRI